MTFIKPHRILQRNLRSGFTFVHRVKRSIDYLCIVVKNCQHHFKIVCWLGYGALSLYKNALMFITTVGVPFLIKLRWPRVEKRKFWELGREIRQQSKMHSFNFGSEYIKWLMSPFPGWILRVLCLMIRVILELFPFVRTDRPDHSCRNDNFPFN